ncbi:MAG: hypothetical protein V4639_06820 [Pseudomonadota bacterium]
MNYVLNHKSEFKLVSRIFPFWHIRQKNGTTRDIPANQLRKHITVVAELLNRAPLEPLTPNSEKDSHFSEEEKSALALFGIHCLFVKTKTRIKCSPRLEMSKSSTSMAKMSEPLPGIAEEPLGLSSSGLNENYDNVDSFLANAQTAPIGIGVHVHCNSKDAKNSTDIGYGGHPGEVPPIPPTSNSTSRNPCAAAKLACGEKLKEIVPPLDILTSQGVKAIPDYDEVSSRRLTGMSIMDCWKQYVALNAGKRSYGKAMFYKLVNDHEKHQVSLTQPDASVHSLAIP